MNLRIFLITCLIVFFACPGEAQHQARKEFNRDWKFRLDSAADYSSPEFHDEDWRVLQLPHDWSIEGVFREEHPAGAGGGALPGGIGWYRKSFTLPASEKGKSVFIEFDGVYCQSEVWINGHRLGKRPNGYISFLYELSPYLHYGEEKNLIAVRVDNSRQPNSRWYTGSGIYRSVWLTILNSQHIDLRGTWVTTPIIREKEAVVHITTPLSGVKKAAVLVTSIYNRKGKKLASVQTATEKDTVRQRLILPRPVLWNIEHPYLYKAINELLIGGKVVDTYATTFGIRYFHFDPYKGFSLNGQAVKILGVCNHHDLGALGAAVNRRALERQLQLLKDMGCNGIRTSHNPPAPDLLELCDSLGFIVMDEAFDMWAKPKSAYDYSSDWKEWHQKDLEDFIVRDRNHPSVFIWSIGNEIPEQWGDEKKGDTSGRVIARELALVVRRLDSTRPVTAANNEINNNQIIRSGALDLIGYNYNHSSWKDFHRHWPGKKLIVTESTSALGTRGYYQAVPFDTIRRWPQRWDIPFTNPNGGYTVSAYDHVSTPWGSTHEESVKALLQNDHVAGMYIWTGFDYLGEPTPYSWPARSSYFGIIDLAGFPKDVYYMYQSVFSRRPVLHLYPHWNWKSGDTVDVVSYYNKADAVELFLNGRSQGVRSKDTGALHVKWRVAFSPGILEARSKSKGRTVRSAVIKTAGPPVKILLKADRRMIRADGKDLSFITVTLVDAKGTRVPDADHSVRFSVEGAGFLVGVDNGDPVSHESFKGDGHRAMNGLALAILQSSGKPGKIVLTAAAEGLQRTAIAIDAK
jgi:beta-galactosidase